MDSALALSLLLSAGIGLSLGVFGGGGSILAVPVLVLVAQLAPAAAVGTSLAMVGATSLIASYAHYRQGHVVPKVALLFGLNGVLTAFLGAKLTALVSGPSLMRAVALLMLVVGVVMFFGKGRSTGAGSPSSGPAPRLAASILAGASVGLVTGFLGVGGGFLVVPALIAFAGLDVRQAVGTSLLVIAINSAAGFAGHISGGQLDFGLIGLLTTAAIAGALAGERVARQASASKLRRGFGLLVIVVGLTVTIASTLSTNQVRSQAQLGREPTQPLAPNRRAPRGPPPATLLIVEGLLDSARRLTQICQHARPAGAMIDVEQRGDLQQRLFLRLGHALGWSNACAVLRAMASAYEINAGSSLRSTSLSSSASAET